LKNIKDTIQSKSTADARKTGEEDYSSDPERVNTQH
jgi:hypothetical protein